MTKINKIGIIVNIILFIILLSLITKSFNPKIYPNNHENMGRSLKIYQIERLPDLAWINKEMLIWMRLGDSTYGYNTILDTVINVLPSDSFMYHRYPKNEWIKLHN